MSEPVSIVKSIYAFPPLIDHDGVTYRHVVHLGPQGGRAPSTAGHDLDSRVTALTGLSPLPGRLGEELYAVSGGLHTSFAFEKGSMAVYIVSINQGKVVDSIPVPDTATMNGMAALPRHPHILLSADSIDGRILSIDTQKHKVDVLLKHDMLGPGPIVNTSSPVPPIGINGLRVRGDHLYFTNSNQGTFVRVRIDEWGHCMGDPEILARSPDAAHIYDDFAFDRAGNAYIATHSSSVFKVTPGGVQTALVDVGGGGGRYADLLAEPTSATLAPDGKSIFVSTGGDFRSFPRKGGQILQIAI
ncbi:hypothetical protein PG984_015843 [Apiospora sp. TS-2023a]